MRRFSLVSFAISGKLIAPGSYSPRNRLSSNQRCGSKTALAAFSRPLNRTTADSPDTNLTKSRTVQGL
ncbi:hypothetical protein ACFWBC_38505 [Streptomyces sp. NPDC059985]|uniref:hypothetical protein n=1 Tax=Streptomyces sp. NPDC059985 TaxID=3347025 RepID=UPI00367DD12D